MDYKKGLLHGMPIGLGYIPVSFTFGMIAVNAGFPIWLALFISMTNLTSAGQFAGLKLLINQCKAVEIIATTFVINLRYMLMSLSLSQKTSGNVNRIKRGIFAFGITDETFAVASLEEEELTFNYMLGLITLPYLGWALGTLLGASINTLLSESLQKSMGIALYAMFVALIVPPAKKSKNILFTISIAIIISAVIKWVGVFRIISEGWSIIIATIVASTIGATFFPIIKEKDYEI